MKDQYQGKNKVNNEKTCACKIRWEIFKEVLLISTNPKQIPNDKVMIPEEKRFFIF